MKLYHLFSGTNSTGGADTGALANITYRAYESTYIRNGSVVTILNLLPVLLVLLIVIAAVVLVKF